jgi:hypothetical protein
MSNWWFLIALALLAAVSVGAALILLFMLLRRRSAGRCPRFQRGIVVPRFFSDPATHARVRQACAALMRRHAFTLEDAAVSGAHKRGVIEVPSDHALTRLFASPSTCRRLQQVLRTPQPPRWLPTVPVELRRYGVGAFMGWHRDTVLKTPTACPQIEVVWVLENASDSVSQWVDDDAVSDKNNDAHAATKSMRLKANDAFVVQGNGVLHRVTPVTKGQRLIVKVAYSL